MRGVWLVLVAALALSAPGRPARAQTVSPGYWERTPLPQTGLATFYAAGLMEYVHGYRRAQQQTPECAECVGSVALLRAGDIGRKVWLQPPGGEAVGPFLVVDCARREDVLPLLARGWVVDVSYEVGRLWGMARPLAGVTVLEDPADAALRAPQGAPTRFWVPADQVVISAPTATPDAAAPAERPTPWPTRQAVALQPQALQPREGAAAGVLPPTPPPLRPLTPIVTTPTPASAPTPTATAPVFGPEAAPGSRAAPGPTTEGSAAATPVEVAVGRPGAELLGERAQPAHAWPWPSPTATERPPARTPRPGLTPILPPYEPAATVTPAAPESPFTRLWRILISLVLH